MLRVQPRAARNQWVGARGEYCKVRIAAAPVDGKANAQLIRFLAESFGVGRAQVTLVTGQSGKIKRLAIDNPRKFPYSAMASHSNQ